MAPRFATATRDGAVHVWSANGRHMRAMSGSGAVQTLGFTGDASRVVAVRRDGAVSNLGAPGCRARGARVTVAAVARDGRHVALGGGPSVRILELRPGDRCRQIELPNPQEVHAVALNLSPDGSVAVVATDDGIVRVYDVRHRTQLATLFAGWRQEARLSMRAGVGGGVLIFTAGDDGRVRQWQVGALPLADRFSTARVDAAAIRADGRLVGAVGGRVLAARWERAEAARRVGSAPGVDAAVFDRRGERMAYTTDRGELVVADLGGAARRIGGRDAGRGVTSLAFSADGRRLVTAQRSGAARVWDVVTDAPPERIAPPAGTTGRASAAFGAGGAVVVADRGVRVHAPGAAPRLLARGTEVADAPAGGTPLAVTATGRLAVALDHAAPLSWNDLARGPAASPSTAPGGW